MVTSRHCTIGSDDAEWVTLCDKQNQKRALGQAGEGLLVSSCIVSVAHSICLQVEYRCNSDNSIVSEKEVATQTLTKQRPTLAVNRGSSCKRLSCMYIHGCTARMQEGCGGGRGVW